MLGLDIHFDHCLNRIWDLQVLEIETGTEVISQLVRSWERARTEIKKTSASIGEYYPIKCDGF